MFIARPGETEISYYNTCLFLKTNKRGAGNNRSILYYTCGSHKFKIKVLVGIDSSGMSKKDFVPYLPQASSGGQEFGGPTATSLQPLLHCPSIFFCVLACSCKDSNHWRICPKAEWSCHMILDSVIPAKVLFLNKVTFLVGMDFGRQYFSTLQRQGWMESA